MDIIHSLIHMLVMLITAGGTRIMANVPPIVTDSDAILLLFLAARVI